ncbi:MAG: Tex-like N-terminal domain-containing protein, partial [Chitinophagaceae bacterium]
MNQYASAIAGKLNLRTIHVEAVLQLFDEGGTVPFIARYRKDKTGAMDEVAIQQVQDEAKRLAEFDERKAAIVKSITEQGKMTEAIMEKL